MDKKIKILGIAPYDGMKTLMLRLAEQRTDIDLTVYVGDLETGAQIASRHTLQDFDVILSRGGTAELISSISPIPVVEIQLSAYDILRAMKLAENYTDRYAIVGYPGITKSAHFLCDLMQHEIDIYTIHSPEEVYPTLNRLISQGYQMVLCDVITNSQAQRLGMRSILFTSGTESIEAAFDQALKTAGIYQALISKTEFFRTLLEDYQYHIFVYDDTAELVYTSKTHNFSTSLMGTLKNYVPDILIERDKKFYRDEGGILVSIRGILKTIHKQTYIAYYINTRKVPLSLIRNGIRYIDKEQAVDQFYSSFYGLNTPDNPSQISLHKLNQTTDPVMLFGSDGTGKEQMAGIIYTQSSYNNKPMAIIDCSLVTKERGWTFLTEHTNSPFSDTSTTIYIREIEYLSDSQFQEVFSIIRDLNLHKRNRIIFSCTLAENEPIPQRCQLLINHFYCQTFWIPPLKNNREEIPNLANLYISILNMELAKEIIGLEPDATAMLQNYQWPGNYNQFRRIMRDLAIMTDTPYMKASSVSKILLRESPILPSQETTGLDLNRTLEEINLDILRITLAKEDGNQTAAAKRLGISRTTLWRMLQKGE